MHRLSFQIGRTRAYLNGQLIHAEICSKTKQSTLFCTFYRRLLWMVPCLRKHGSNDYVSLLRSETGNLVHTLRSDNRGEFISFAYKSWLSDLSIGFIFPRFNNVHFQPLPRTNVLTKINRRFSDACKIGIVRVFSRYIFSATEFGTGVGGGITTSSLFPFSK